MEPCAMTRVSILLQPHRTAVANFVPGKFGPFRWNPWTPGSHSRNPSWKTL